MYQGYTPSTQYENNKMNLEAEIADLEEERREYVRYHPDCSDLDFVRRMEILEAQRDYMNMRHWIKDPKHLKTNGVYTP